MPDIVVVGNSAGGAIANSAGVTATLNGSPIAVRGNAVAPHPPCPTAPVHCTAVTTASPSATLNGIPIVVDGDPATCGHPASATNTARLDQP